MFFQAIAVLFFGGNCLYNIVKAVEEDSYSKSDCIAAAVLYGIVASVFIVFWGHAV